MKLTFDKLSSVGGLVLSDNAVLTSLAGFAVLESVTESIVLELNPGLENLAGLEQLRTVGRQIVIASNEGIRSLQGLEGITSVGGLRIMYNDSLATLAPLNTWADGTMRGAIIFEGNDLLPQCEVDIFDLQQTHPNAACPQESKFECVDNDGPSDACP